MPQTRENGAVVPINSDEYNLTADLATFADSLNVPVVVAGLTERNALAPHEGMTVIRLDLNGLQQVYANGAWRTNYAAPFRQYYAKSIQSVSGTGGTWTISFPAGLFTLAPLVQLTKHSPGGAGYIPYVSSTTTTEAVIGVYWEGNTGGFTVTMAIHAIQATPTVTAGAIG